MLPDDPSLKPTYYLLRRPTRLVKKVKANQLLQQAIFIVSFPCRDKAKLTTVFKALQSSLSGKKQFFATSRYQDNCLLLIDTAFCVDAYEKITEFDGDTLYIYDKETNNGLWLDANKERWTDKKEYLWTYEPRVRGLDRMDKAHKAYRLVQAVS